MKSLFILICLLAVAFTDTGRQSSSAIEDAVFYPGRADITLSIEPLVSHHKSKRDNWLGLLLFAS